MSDWSQASEVELSQETERLAAERSRLTAKERALENERLRRMQLTLFGQLGKLEGGQLVWEFGWLRITYNGFWNGPMELLMRIREQTGPRFANAGDIEAMLSEMVAEMRGSGK